MKKACLFVSHYLLGNRVFEDGAFRDDINYKYICLKEALGRAGYELCTQDIHSAQASDVVIYASDMPKRLPQASDIEKSYLITWESEFIRPDNFDRDKHQHFKKVFTWHDGLVKEDGYLKINFSHRFPSRINKSLTNKSKLFTLISGNKKPPHTTKNDLYGERVNAIRWFEDNQPEDFDLYGVGWDRHFFSGPRLIRLLNRFPIFCRLVMRLRGECYPSYQGLVKDKKSVMENYRFSICYENVSGIPGYITEKLFDSFFAGCVPVYWGAPNVRDYIPEGCFIDMRKFRSYKELHDYVSAMTDAEYLEYLENIEAFIRGDESSPFRAEYFAKRICEGIVAKSDS